MNLFIRDGMHQNWHWENPRIFLVYNLVHNTKQCYTLECAGTGYNLPHCPKSPGSDESWASSLPERPEEHFFRYQVENDDKWLKIYFRDTTNLRSTIIQLNYQI